MSFYTTTLPTGLLAYAPPDAELIYAGKVGGAQPGAVAD
jgi:hypothetical protein